MIFEGVLLCCSLFLQGISGQCIGAYDGWGAPGYGAPGSGAPGYGAPGYGAPYGAPYAAEFGCGPAWPAAPLAVDWAGISAANGGGFAVSSASPIAPVGVSVLSDNAIEGALAVGGALPYVGAVSLEAALPTVGAGSVAYGCGNGAVEITAEDVGGVGFVGVAGPLGFVPGITGPLGPGLAGPIGFGLGCGCGAIL